MTRGVHGSAVRMSPLRGALRAHPRLILAVLLAFAVEMLPPSALVSHHHTGAGIAHTHVGRIVGTARAVAPRVGELRVPAGAPGFEQSAARDLHQHVTQPLVAVRGPAAPSPGPALVTSDLSASATPAEIPAALCAGQARSPPTRSA